jgi:SAM-dependent methyltransferase
VEMRIQEWVEVARDRHVSKLLVMPEGPQLNLGAGRREIGEAIPLDKEHGWNADREPIPFESESIAGIWAHAFLDYVVDPVAVLAECQRVLMPGGVMNIVGPHGLSDLWEEDLLRRNRFHEMTWRNLFDNPWYDAQAEGPRLNLFIVHACFIFGVDWRNLSLFTQLLRQPWAGAWS